MTEEQIKRMTDRFLSWRLPVDFHPDNGISVKRPNYRPEVQWELYGTNLFDARQAEEMVRYMIEGMPHAKGDLSVTLPTVEESEQNRSTDIPPTVSAQTASSNLVSVEGDDIVIRVTLDALVFASEHGCLCTFSPVKNDFRTVKVTYPVAWRDAIVRALRREKENGDTPVHLMLDAALEYAADQGEEGIHIEGIDP